MLPAVAATASAEVQLNGVTYPDGRTVTVSFAVTPAGPEKAKITADVRASGNTTGVTLEYRDLPPAVLFSRDITSYILWAVSPAGETDNLGEIGGTGESGTIKASTSRKVFALMITAEPIAAVSRAGELVVFIARAPKDKNAPGEPFSFDRFVKREQITVGNPSVRGMQFHSKEVPVLMQARKAVELVDRFHADSYAADSVAQARIALTQAESLYVKNNRSGGADQARRAIAYSTEALGKYLRDREAQAEAQRRQMGASTRAALRSSETARGELEIDRASLTAEKERLEAEKTTLQSQKTALEAEKTRLEGEKSSLQEERDAMARRLSGALTSVASMEQTGRGFVVSFGDINFETGKSKLKPSAELSLAKLAGILTMTPDLNLRIEGHTDATGSDAANMRLSADRAASVKSALLSDGIAEQRMTTAGYGKPRPIAPNETKEGRASNRRVEIVLATGTIAAPPGTGGQ